MDVTLRCCFASSAFFLQVLIFQSDNFIFLYFHVLAGCEQKDVLIGKVMRDAKSKEDTIPSLQPLSEDYTMSKLYILITHMTKYNPKQRIGFRMISREVKAIKALLMD